MELSDVISLRRSIRKFREREISKENIRLLLESARMAPSGSNIQPARFVVIQSPEAKEELARCTPYKFIKKASVIFACCADLASIKGRPERLEELMREGAFEGVDVDRSDPAATTIPVLSEDAIRAYLSLNVAIAVEHIVLKAVELGLGSCWLGGFDRAKLKSYLELDDSIHPVVLLPVGYPDQLPKQRPRFDLDKLVLKTI